MRAQVIGESKDMKMSGRVISELGNKYSRLLVVDFVGYNKRNAALWKCVCDCGNNAVVTGIQLRKGRTRSCGCLHRESIAKNREKNTLPEGQSGFNMLYDSYRRRAEESSLDFDLTKEDVSFLTQMNCFYCNCIPKQTKHSSTRHGDYTYNGIDRIDNTKGYTMDNVVSCCKICNYMKRNMTTSEFKHHILEIIEHRNWVTR